MRRSSIVMVLLVSSLAACSGVASVTDPDIGAHGGGAAHGDSWSFSVNGSMNEVTESGHIKMRWRGYLGFNYSGPLGCAAHFFTGHYSDHIGVEFHYSAVDAVMAVANDAYHFVGPPEQRGDQLVWDHTFKGPGISRHLVARVQCPFPTDATTPLDPSGLTPPADTGV